MDNRRLRIFKEVSFIDPRSSAHQIQKKGDLHTLTREKNALHNN
jgi:hypothetical protein